MGRTAVLIISVAAMAILGGFFMGASMAPPRIQSFHCELPMCLLLDSEGKLHLLNLNADIRTAQIRSGLATVGSLTELIAEEAKHNKSVEKEYEELLKQAKSKQKQ